MTTPQRAGRFRFTLTQRILLGLALGCLIGWLFPSFATSLKPFGTMFVRLIRMVVAPLLLTTLVAGIAVAGGKAAGRLGLKAIVWFVLATTVALCIGLVTANLVNPGIGVKPPGAHGANTLAKTKTFLEFLTDAIPTSILDAMSRNDMLQIVVFSVFLGLAISAAGSKADPLKHLLEAGAEVMFKMVGFVMWFAPFGVGAAIAATLGASGLTVLLPLVKCIVALYAALIVFFILLFTATKILTRVHMSTFLGAIREPAVIAFTTASSEAALPRSMQILEQLGIPRRIVGFVVPTGYAFNLDGSTLYLSLAIVFVAQVAGVDMTLGQQVEAMLILWVSSKGLAGVPRAALVVLFNVLPDLHLSDEGAWLLFGIDALMDMGRTCVNVVGNCVATVIVGVWERAIPDDAPIFHPRAAPASELPTAEVVADRVGADDSQSGSRTGT
ncbi:MAG TPA: dicarboxylate/amino acid:cation symporter [Kofleriaceae bacterium]|jgi:proton glutamate symport protein|nr:dicarboxylate/amino acid:cation symporter [Kofleriaceae bacterium]